MYIHLLTNTHYHLSVFLTDLPLKICVPVYFAAQEGHLDTVKYLVEVVKSDPTLASNDGMTPLHAAAQTGRLNLTHWLVRSANCPMDCHTSDGATPIHFAAAKG